MDCPKCPGKMEEVKIGKTEPFIIDRCFACGGLWFDKDELAKAVNKEILDTVEFELESELITDDELRIEVNFDKIEIACPRCKGVKKMTKIPSPRNKNIVIDFCENCTGIWLDASEYNSIRKRNTIEIRLESIIDFFRLHFPHILKENK